MEKMEIYSYHRTDKKNNAKRTFKVSVPTTKALVKRGIFLFSFDTTAVLLLAFLCGRAVLFGELAPLGVAFAAGIAAIFPEYGLISGIFAAAGYITVLEGSNLASTIGGMALIHLILYRYHQRFRQLWYGTSALVLGVTIVVKAGVFAYEGADLYRLITVLFESALACGLTYIFFRAAPLIKRKQIRTFKLEERLFVVFILVGLIAGFNSINIGNIDIQRFISCFVILIAVFIGGSGWGAATGTLVGAVPSLSAFISPGIIGYFAFTGLLAGAFRNFGRIGISIGFLLGDVLLSIYFGGSSNLVSSLLGGLLAVFAFLCLPTKVLYRTRTTVRNIFADLGKSPKEQQIRGYSSRKIRDFSRVFSEVAKTVEQVSCEAQSDHEQELQQLFSGITNKVCNGCSLYRVCWEVEFYKTYKNIMDLLAALELHCRIEEEHLAPELRKRCIRLKELAITVNCLYETYKTNHYWKRKISESREVVSGQLRGVSKILQNLADEVRLDVQMREDIEAILKSELAKAGHSVIDLTVVSLGGEKLEVIVSSPSCGGKLKCAKVINPFISKILGQRMTVINNNYCSRKTGESVCEFKLHPAKNLNVNVGEAKRAKEGHSVSGDTSSTIELKDGKMALLLSDGMGVGSKASLESKATIDLLEQLLETGFDTSLAVKTVNSLLLLRSPEESFSTVDLAIIDQFSGNVEFMKIGAAPSFIKRAGRVEVVRHSSLPMGILNNIEVECISFQLNPSDLIIMMSDGVLDSKKENDNKEDWVITLLQSVVTSDPQNIADLILNRAIQNAGGIADDDMTVLVAEVTTGALQ